MASKNPEKLKAYRKAWRMANREKMRAYRKAWRMANREKLKAYNKAYRTANPEKHRSYNKAYRLCNLEKIKITKKRRIDSLREQVIAHYSQGKFVCACCGDNRKCFLTIDHITPIGGLKRKELRQMGRLPEYLLQHNFPDGYQVLCSNCNFLKSSKLYCPCGTKYPTTQEPVVQFNAPLTNQ